MKDVFHNLLTQEKVELAKVNAEAVLSACVNTHMASEGERKCQQ